MCSFEPETGFEQKYSKPVFSSGKTINPHYSPNLLKMNANAGYPDLDEPNFGQLDWL